MRKKIRTICVGVLVFTMTVDPAAAFHLFRRCGGYYRSYAPVCGPSYVSYYQPVARCGCHSCQPVVVHQGCCGVVTQGHAPTTAPTGGQPATVNRPQPDLGPAPKAPSDTPVPRLPADVMTQPAGGDTESVPPVRVPAERLPVTPPPTEPTRPAATGDDLFGPTGGMRGATPTETRPAATGDLFGPTGGGASTTPATETRPADADRDLFGPTGGGGTATTPPAKRDQPIRAATCSAQPAVAVQRRLLLPKRDQPRRAAAYSARRVVEARPQRPLEPQSRRRRTCLARRPQAAERPVKHRRQRPPLAAVCSTIQPRFSARMAGWQATNCVSGSIIRAGILRAAG
jgi:hypothetical protein